MEYQRLFSIKVPESLPMREKAILFATVAHSGQSDKSGHAYIFHPLRVMDAAERAGLDIISQVGGVLHDTVEDTDASLTEVEHHFGTEVAGVVDALSRRVHRTIVINGVPVGVESYPTTGGKEPYQEFLNRVELNGRARRLKLLDIRDNMRPDRKVPGLTGLNGRYVKARDFLATKMLQRANPVDLKFLTHLGIIEVLSAAGSYRYIGFDHWD